MIRKQYEPSELVSYFIYKDEQVIDTGSFEVREKGEIKLPYNILKSLPPNITVELIRETGEKDSYFLGIDLERHIPRFSIPNNDYRIDVSWDRLERNLEWFTERYNQTIEEILNPEFQRGHVWTEEQQISYIEYILKGGKTGKEVYFNCKSWVTGEESPIYCIDGLQRITAVRRFMNNEIPVFGNIFLKDTTGVHSMHQSFSVHVLDFKKESEMLQWYIDMNSCGVVHSKEELDKVRNMIK